MAVDNSIRSTLNFKKLDRAAKEGVRNALLRASRLVLQKAKDRAPKGFFGDLKKSGFIDKPVISKSELEIRLGFSSPYAQIMDTGWNVTEIVPVRAKVLYIPLTLAGAIRGPKRRGGRRRLANRPLGNPKGRSSRSRRKIKDQDYTFAKRVRVPKARKGRRRGPNKFFSGTIADVSKDESFLRKIGEEIQAQLRK